MTSTPTMTDCGRCLLDWLLGEEPVPTWRSLCAALRTPSVNETRVASVIERERIFVDLELSGVSPASSMFGVIREFVRRIHEFSNTSY